MTQNTSHAVMAQRAEPHDSLDFFPTPPWATRALLEHCLVISGLRRLRVWEPACGDGAMARAIGEYASVVACSDVHDYGFGHTHDFLLPFTPFPPVDWIITNPPFRLAEQFVWRGLEIAEHGVAVLVRSVFVESVGRYERLFKPRPPAIMAQFVERVPMVKGRLDQSASTATSYCWLIWTIAPVEHTKLVWIPPCRARLERASDYDVPEAA
jgi:hypothetical protein